MRYYNYFYHILLPFYQTHFFRWKFKDKKFWDDFKGTRFKGQHETVVTSFCYWQFLEICTCGYNEWWRRRGEQYACQWSPSTSLQLMQPVSIQNSLSWSKRSQFDALKYVILIFNCIHWSFLLLKYGAQPPPLLMSWLYEESFRPSFVVPATVLRFVPYIYNQALSSPLLCYLLLKDFKKHY